MPRRRSRPPIEDPDAELASPGEDFDGGGDGEFEGRFEGIGEDGTRGEILPSGGIAEEGLAAGEYGADELPEEVAPRRETRQELLGRLMRRLLFARERVHVSLEQVRDYNTELHESGPRPPEKLKEQFHHTVEELSAARREENFGRTELIQMLGWRS